MLRTVRGVMSYGVRIGGVSALSYAVRVRIRIRIRVYCLGEMVAS